MAAPRVWDQLSKSSKKAMRWAGAAARVRAQRKGDPAEQAIVNEFDLLVGILMSHPVDSEPRVLLEHIGASAADLLPPDYPLPTPAELDDHIHAVPEDGPTELAPSVEDTLFDTLGWASANAGVVELRGLFGALLDGQNEVSTAARTLLARLGLPGVVETYAQYFASAPPGSYREWLRQYHPYSAAPVEIPTYKPDHGPGSRGDDFVDIRAEVDAFAYLLASRGLRPPLAVGLFGDWGSGKTYFMDALRARISELVGSDEVASKPQGEVPFWKSVVQIEFNAWHYVEGDLWASLVEHVFSRLQLHDKEQLSRVGERQRHWLQQIDAKLRERGDLVLVKEEKEKEHAEKQKELATKETERQTKEAELHAAEQRLAADVVLTDSLDTVKAALAGLVDAQLDGEPAKALAAVDGARAELRRGQGLVHAFSWRDKRSWLAVGALIAVPVVVGAMEALDIPSATQAFTGIAGVLAAVSAALRGAADQVRKRLDKLEAAAAEARKEIGEKRAALDAEVASARTAAAQAAAEVADLAAQEQAITAEIDQLNERVAAVTSGALLSEFVSDRVKSVDYRARLGTPALVQRDFLALSELIREANDKYVEEDKGGPPKPETLNRVILYIDDLDRCEPKRVVQVLQAVHLLLAFELFVVVVAVDSRWLSKSLAEHYPALAGTRGGEAASPADYLEKIFQVPFWIEPLTAGARKTMVRGLLQGNLVFTSSGDDGGGSGGALSVDDEQRKMLDDMFSRRGAVQMQTAALGISPDELNFLDGLAPLLGDTPRSVKRFVNVYQLLCALPEPAANGNGPTYPEMIGFLLALTEGMPDLMDKLRGRLDEHVADETLEKAVELVSGETDTTAYDAWILGRADWDDFPLQHLAIPAERVRRFSFR